MSWEEQTKLLERKNSYFYKIVFICKNCGKIYEYCEYIKKIKKETCSCGAKVEKKLMKVDSSVIKHEFIKI